MNVLHRKCGYSLRSAKIPDWIEKANKDGDTI